MLVSQSATTDMVSTGGDIVKQAKDELGIDDDAIVQLSDDEYNKEETPASDADWDDEEDW
jgi:hypothetical protein